MSNVLSHSKESFFFTLMLSPLQQNTFFSEWWVYFWSWKQQ